MKKALGSYFNENPEDKNIPYAVKTFHKPTLKEIKSSKQDGKLCNRLDTSEIEIFLAGEFDHPNISKTFVCYDTERNPEGKYYVKIELGNLGQIASTEEFEDGKTPIFTLNQKVYECVLKHVDNENYAPFCKSLKEKVA